MNDESDDVLVDICDNDNTYARSIIQAAGRDEAIAKADEWARVKSQETGKPLLIGKRPGHPGSKVFDPPTRRHSSRERQGRSGAGRPLCRLYRESIQETPVGFGL